MELTAIAGNIIQPGTLLNAVDNKDVTFLNLLIECEQKEVIAYSTIQMYLSEVWTGHLSHWSSWKFMLIFIAMALVPPLWAFLSLPLKFRINNIPIVKFMSHLVSHLYLIVLYILCTVYPTEHIWDLVYGLPNWYEWLLLIWLSGLLVEQLTSNETISGLAWLRVFLLGISALGILCNIASFCFSYIITKSEFIYVRNQLFALSMLLAFVLLMEFLSFHHLFGPWAIIIRELMKDLLRFIVVLAIFLFGFTFQMSAIYLPVFKPSNMSAITQGYPGSDIPPKRAFEILFFALFGLIDPHNLPKLAHQPWWSVYLVKGVVGLYMLITVVTLINLLIAMMTDTYADIQAQSDVEWKFGRAKLFQNMDTNSSSPSPIILITKLCTYISLLSKFRGIVSV